MLASATPAAAQAVSLVRSGDVFPGFGTVHRVEQIAVADGGHWLAQLRTTTGEYLIVRDGVVILKTGDPLGTSGASYGSFSSIDLNAGLESAFAVSGGPFGGVYFGTTPLVIEQMTTGAPGFSPGTVYNYFATAKLNDARQMLASVSVDDPALPGFSDDALMLFQTDAAGTLLSEIAVVKQGDLLPGLSSPIEQVAESSRGIAINAAGDVLAQAAYGSDEAILLNQTVVARSGGPSPIFGSPYVALYDTVALGDGGDTAFLAYYAGGFGIVWNGIEVAHAGKSLPDFAPYLIEKFGGRPIAVDAQGRIVWFADWDDADLTRDTGFVRDHELILQEGVSLAGGVVIDEFGYEAELSSDGRYFAFLATRADGSQGAFLLDLASSITPFQGCAPNAATLGVTGSPTLGGSLSLVMKQAQGDGVAGFVGIATSLVGAPPCGIVVPGLGELLIGTPAIVFPMAAWIPPLGLCVGTLNVPDQLALLGAQVYLQGLFVDVGGLTPSEPLRLTDGVSVHVGP